MNIKEYANLINLASEKNIDSKEFAKEMWQLLYRDKLLNKIDAIFDMAKALHHERQNQLEAKVISAVELSSDEIDTIRKNLGARFNKEIIISQQVDAGLGSGIIVTVKDSLIDLSANGKIKQLSRKLKEQS